LTRLLEIVGVDDVDDVITVSLRRYLDGDAAMFFDATSGRRDVTQAIVDVEASMRRAVLPGWSFRSVRKTKYVWPRGQTCGTTMTRRVAARCCTVNLNNLCGLFVPFLVFACRESS
jgi:hypothetical protein